MFFFADIGANLTDEMFDGVYNGTKKHDPDRTQVLERAWHVGVEKIIITVGTIFDCEPAFKIAATDGKIHFHHIWFIHSTVILISDRIYCTVGIHPTRCSEFLVSPDNYFGQLVHQIEENKSKVVAIGEIGLDYDRLHFCEPDVQKKYFEKQLELADTYNLPLFLHCRSAHDDLIKIIESNQKKIRRGGVVHTFDGTLDQAKKFIAMGFYIGINGCSLKTDANLEVVKALPNDKIMLETDAPWCEIRPSHAGYKHVVTKFETTKKKEKKKWQKEILVAGRNEPVAIV